MEEDQYAGLYDGMDANEAVDAMEDEFEGMPTVVMTDQEVMMPDVASYPASHAPSELAEMQRRLDEASSSADHWKMCLNQVAHHCGLPPSGQEPDVLAIVESIKSLRARGASSQTVGVSLQDPSQEPRKDAFLHLMLSERNLEAIELRRELTAALGAADTNVVQLKQLMLDPALNREFVKLRSELEASRREVKAAQEELAAMAFNPDSKLGKQLVSKCRSLADENEEMGQDLSEGRVHQLETQLAMAREYAVEMRQQAQELEEHCTVMDEEMEEIQMDAFALRKEVAELKVELAAARDREASRAPDTYGGRRNEGGAPLPGPPLRGGDRDRDLGRGGERERDRDRERDSRVDRDRDRGGGGGVGVIGAFKRSLPPSAQGSRR